MSTTTTGKSKLHAIKTRQSNYNQTFSTENNNNLPHTSQPLGFPLPKDEHACSVSLPTWSSVVGYEEGDIAITSQLKCGYPRFVYHPYVIQLMHTVLDKYSTKIPSKSSSSQPTTQTTTVKTESSMDDVSTSCNTASDHYYYTEDCLVVPTKVAALRCQSFLQLALQEYKNHELIDNALISISHNNNKEATSSLSSSSSSRVRVIEWNILSDNNDTDTSNNDNTTIYAVLFPATTVAGMQAKAYWQHTGEVVSSRRAENYLYQLKIPITCRITGQQHCTIYNPAFITTCATNAATKLREDICHTNDDKENQQPQQLDDTKKSSSSVTTSSSSPHEQLRINIAQWAGINDPDFVFLNPSGMASIYASLRSSRRYQLSSNTNHHQNCGGGGGGTSIVYGFPYLDTLKLCSRPEFSPSGVEFFGMGCSNDLHNLEMLLQKTKKSNDYNNKTYCALFTEVPSNPLLQCPDLRKLRQLADEHNFCLIVDDTISNFLNVDVLSTGIADAVCTSLTKLISGRGDAIAGSIVCNPYTEKGKWMQQDLYNNNYQQNGHDATNNNAYGGLHASDANAILHNSQDFMERNDIINSNATRLADWLHSTDDCPDVDTVYYPKLNKKCVDNYHSVMRKGYGGLLSMTLHSNMCQRHFYDALDVAKGPSLGTNFTLVCPYTLLAHYHELDFAMGYNVPPNLLRIAVGMEPFEEIQSKFYTAFQTSRLYPKPKKIFSSNEQRQQPTQQQSRSYTTTNSATFTNTKAWYSNNSSFRHPYSSVDKVNSSKRMEKITTTVRSQATTAVRRLVSLVRR